MNTNIENKYRKRFKACEIKIMMIILLNPANLSIYINRSWNLKRNLKYSNLNTNLVIGKHMRESKNTLKISKREFLDAGYGIKYF